jgi:glycosyltransferase involved in cell wall biosynthesis
LVRLGTPRRKLSVIHNGVVTDRIDIPVSLSAVDEWKRRISWEPSRRTIGIVARLKEQEVVVQALDRVKLPVRLVLAGMESSDRLARHLERVPSRHAVVCLPFVSDVRPLYELLELVLLPSRMEGLSQALLEAMALGKPVIASAATGNLELIRDNHNGRLVPPGDLGAWAAAIEALLADGITAARLGDAARTTARENFSLQRTIERTADLYRSILGQNG